MPVILKDSAIESSSTMSIGASSSNYGITIDSTGRVRFPYQPMFFAYGVANNTWQNQNDWQFPSTLVNTGGHYSTSTGRFTAPVAGTYVFYWAQIGGSTAATYRYFLHKNGTVVGSGDVHLRLQTTYTGRYSHGGERFYMIDLAANDYVYIRYWSTEAVPSYPFANSASDIYPTFSGWLLA